MTPSEGGTVWNNVLDNHTRGIYINAGTGPVEKRLVGGDDRRERGQGAGGAGVDFGRGQSRGTLRHSKVRSWGYSGLTGGMPLTSAFSQTQTFGSAKAARRQRAFIALKHQKSGARR